MTSYIHRHNDDGIEYISATVARDRFGISHNNWHALTTSANPEGLRRHELVLPKNGGMKLYPVSEVKAQYKILKAQQRPNGGRGVRGNVAALADKYAVSRKAVYAGIRRGRLDAVVNGAGALEVKEEDFCVWLAMRPKPGRPPKE